MRILAVAVALAVVLGVAASGCIGSGGGGRAHEISGHKLSEPEWLYGQAPPPAGPDVSYKPDVVLIGGGPKSIKGVTLDGLTWTIDGGAGNADDLQPGKIMFASGHAVGRVLAVSDADGDKAVTLGPVDLTDIYEELHTSSEQPVSLDDFIGYPDPGLSDDSAYKALDDARMAERGANPDASDATTSTTESSKGAVLPPVELASAVGPAQQPPRGGTTLKPTKQLTESPVGPFKVTPRCCNGGVGIHASYDVNGTKVEANALLRMVSPRVTFDISIGKGALISAEFALRGGLGLHFDFTAGSVNGQSANVFSPPLVVPIDISIPLFLGVIPASFSLQQYFIIQTAFSAKNSVLSASGDYGFDGALGFQIKVPQVAPLLPGNFRVDKSMLQSVDGASVGINSLVFSWAAKASIGLGIAGFQTGLWAKLVAGITATRGSDLGILVCKQSTLDIDVSAGLGWSIPKIVADLINTFLKVFKVEPVPNTGGQTFISETLVHREGRMPKVKLCVG